MLEKILQWYREDEIFYIEGFNGAIIGIDGDSKRLIYSVSKCVKILMSTMNEEDALKYFNDEVKGFFIIDILGPNAPIFCIDDL